jgi:hypothetical protein
MMRRNEVWSRKARARRGRKAIESRKGAVHENLIEEGAIEMLGALAADAIFCAAVFFEIIAALSILDRAHAIQLREELDPIFAFYHAHAEPVAAWGTNLIPARISPWYADAYIIAAVFFFLFFIAQARKAMAPYDDKSLTRPAATEPSRVETAVDTVLPPVFCAIGAFLSAVTLLPLLTLPAALWLLGRRILGWPGWFEVSRSYYLNILVLIAAIAVMFTLPRS